MRRRTRTHDFFSRKKSVIVISAESILPHPSSFFSAASPEPVQSTRQTPTHPPESLSGLQLQTCAHLQQQQQHQQHHPLHPQKRLHRRRQQHHRAFLWWVSSQNLRKSSTFWILKMEERKRKTETKTDSRFFSILAKKVKMCRRRRRETKKTRRFGSSWIRRWRHTFVCTVSLARHWLDCPPATSDTLVAKSLSTKPVPETKNKVKIAFVETCQVSLLSVIIKALSQSNWFRPKMSIKY